MEVCVLVGQKQMMGNEELQTSLQIDSIYFIKTTHKCILVIIHDSVFITI